MAGKWRTSGRWSRRGTVCLLFMAGGLPAAGPALAQSDVPLGRGWQHAVMSAPGLPSLLSSPTYVAAAGPGLVVSAYLQRGPAIGVWDSADGRTWRAVPIPSLPSDERLTGFDAAGQIYIFTTASTSGSNAPPEPHIWASHDEGATWRESSAQFSVAAVAPSSDGIVAFSRNLPPSQGSSVWTSADGLTWRQAPNTADEFASADVTSLAQGPQGLVAGGETLQPGEQRAGIWTSPDGLTWTQVPNDGGIFGNGSDGSHVDDVVAGPRGIVAIGQRYVDHKQLAWASPDGVHWQTAATPFVDSADYLPHLVAWQGGFVYFNVDPFAGTDVWSSVDGLTWTELGGDELFSGTARVQSAVSFQGEVVAVGNYAAHPTVACLRASDPTTDLQTFQPAVFVWNATTAPSAPPPRIDPADPQAFGLRPSDIGGNTDQPMSGTYLDLCGLNAALGRHLAYEQDFFDPDGAIGSGGLFFAGKALSIVTGSPARARSAFRHLDGFFDEAGASITRRREVKARARIGDETRFVRLQAVTVGESAGIPFTRCAVAWRMGRVIGVVVTGAWQESVKLARLQLSRLEHPLKPELRHGGGEG